MTDLQLGYFANPEYSLGASISEAVDDQRRVVRAARDLRFRAVLVGEHLSREKSVWLPPLPLLGHVASEGAGMTFGTAVLAAGLHQPVTLAEQVALLDNLTGGKFVLGLSAGWNRLEFDSLSVPFKGRTRRLEETVEILRLLWQSTEPVTYRGEVYGLDKVFLSLKPTRSQGVPIWLGASSDPALRRAARIGDAWIASSHLSNTEVVEQAAKYRTFRSEVDLSTPTIRPGLRNIFVAKTMEAAVAEAGPYLVSSYGVLNDWGLFTDVLGQSRDELDFARAAGRAIIGDPDTVAEELVGFLGGSGINLLLVRSQWLGISMSKIIDSLSLLASDVLPKVCRALQG